MSESIFKAETPQGERERVYIYSALRVLVAHPGAF